MAEPACNVTAHWDPEARVRVATSEDIPGLVAEAETTEELIEILKDLVPDLLQANGIVSSDDSPGVPFVLHALRAEVAPRHVA